MLFVSSLKTLFLIWRSFKIHLTDQKSFLLATAKTKTMSTNQDKSDVGDDINVGMPSKSFYGNYSAKSNSRKYRALKRKLDSACENVKVKRTRDLLLNEQNSVKNILSDPIPLVYRVFNKQSDALDFAQHWDSFRVFANELNDKGHRHFISCHPQTFWRLLKAKSPDTRYAYEVIGDIFPSKVSIIFKVNANVEKLSDF